MKQIEPDFNIIKVCQDSEIIGKIKDLLAHYPNSKVWICYCFEINECLNFIHLNKNLLFYILIPVVLLTGSYEWICWRRLPPIFPVWQSSSWLNSCKTNLWWVCKNQWWWSLHYKDEGCQSWEGMIFFLFQF